MELKGKKVLVTGADGFIGSNMVEELLEKGAIVRAFVFYNSFNSWGWLDTFSEEKLKKIEIFQGDVRDPWHVAEAVKGCDFVFHLAVKKRMLAADVEIGALLSGGVDSTLVTAYAQKYVSHPIKTFSVGYQGYANELPYAKQASEKIGTDHYTLEVKGNLTDELEKIIAYMDEPHADSSNFPQHLVSQLAATKVKVALSGDGADELFMGYGWYWKYWNANKINRVKNSIFSSPFKEYLKTVSVFNESDRAALWKDNANSRPTTDVLPELIDEVKDNFQKINFFDLTTYLSGQLLAKVDQTSMMHSLEIRCPFLDQTLAEYVYNLPTKFKANQKNGKIILKDILSEIMPAEFINRRKQGFGAPIKEWLKTPEMKDLVHENLADKDAHIYAYLRSEIVQDMLDDFYVKEDIAPHYKIWLLLCLELWFKAHSKYHIEI